MNAFNTLYKPLTLPCGVVLKNRLAKAAMSDSLGDGVGNPTQQQMRLYERWAEGGVALSIIGEVQCNPCFAEKPGNLVLNRQSDIRAFENLAKSGAINNAQLWAQLGHAGAMSFPPISNPKGPSALDLPGVTCAALTVEEIQKIPDEMASTAVLARQIGFGGVEVHTAHGFLLSQFLSPLFNKRHDGYGGSVNARMRLLMDVVDCVREAVGPDYPVAVKMNATDQLQGGFDQNDALAVVSELNNRPVDLIDISGGTYFPGATAASDTTGSGPYFTDFARHARQLTDIPLMVTGGFKKRIEAISAIESGFVDMAGLARAFIVDPNLPNTWAQAEGINPVFPRFNSPPEGGVTAWYTMRLTDLATDLENSGMRELTDAVLAYEARDAERATRWIKTHQ